MVKFILIKSPDEWATTKQACRDELVVYLFFSSIYIYIYRERERVRECPDLAAFRRALLLFMARL